MLWKKTPCIRGVCHKTNVRQKEGHGLAGGPLAVASKIHAQNVKQVMFSHLGNNAGVHILNVLVSNVSGHVLQNILNVTVRSLTYEELDCAVRPSGVFGRLVRTHPDLYCVSSRQQLGA